MNLLSSHLQKYLSFFLVKLGITAVIFHYSYLVTRIKVAQCHIIDKVSEAYAVAHKDYTAHCKCFIT